MHSTIVRKAKAARLFGFGVMLAGFVPVLLFVALSILMSAGTGHVTDMFGQFQGWSALEKLGPFPSPLQAGLMMAVVGFAVMMLGAALARRQMPVLEAAERDRMDGLRRTSQYYDGERIEPYIGPHP